MTERTERRLREESFARWVTESSLARQVGEQAIREWNALSDVGRSLVTCDWLWLRAEGVEPWDLAVFLAAIRTVRRQGL